MPKTTVEVALASSKVSLPDGLSPWILGIKAKVGGRILANLSADTDGVDRYIECAEVAELPGAFLCCSFYQSDMNDAFTRMGIFMGAGRGVQENTVMSHGDPVLRNYKKLVAGHNLPGPAVSRFYSRLLIEKNSDLGLNEFEGAFHNDFLQNPAVKALGDQFYLIGLSIQNMKTYQSVVTHEIFHALYFLNPDYRETVRRFWSESISEKDRTQITEVIGQAYNTENLELVIDEFQAYLLQSGAHQDRMKLFVERYQAALSEQLALRGIALLRGD
jgi:hypothetical protein